MATEKKPTKNEETEIAPESVVGSDAALLDQSVTALFTHTLSRPVEYEGEKYESLTFDFDSLTGGDSIDVETELLAKGHPVISKSIDTQYLMRMCARACTADIDYNIFRALPVKDFNRIIATAKRFL